MSRTRSITTAWRAACRRAGIKDLHFHDLRREAGSRWLEGGVPLLTVRNWLGHSNISQTSTSLESTLMGEHDAMKRFEELRDGGVQGRENKSRNEGTSAPPEDTGAERKTQETIQ